MASNGCARGSGILHDSPHTSERIFLQSMDFLKIFDHQEFIASNEICSRYINDSRIAKPSLSPRSLQGRNYLPRERFQQLLNTFSKMNMQTSQTDLTEKLQKL